MNAIDRAKLLEWTRANLCPLCERVIGIGLEYGAFDIKPHEGRTGQAIRVPGESNGRMKPMTDTEKKIAEVLDLSKPVSDCPECGGLGEIRSLGSRRKCECLYIRLKTLKRELDLRDEENRKLREKLDAVAEGYRQQVKLAGELMDKLSFVQEQEQKLIKKLREITKLLGGVTFTDGRQWGAYNALCDIVEDIEKELSK